MSQARSKPEAAAPGAQKMDLETTAQFLLFEPGLYAIDFAAARSVRTDIGLRLPAIRLEPLPAAHYAGRAFVSFAADGGWLSASNEAAFVLVTGGQAGLILTVYKMAGATPGPEIRIRALNVQGLASPAASAAAVPTPLPAASPEADSGLPLGVLAHVRAVGDIRVAGSAWAGRPGSGQPVEGFSITPAAPLAAEDIEYQAMLGHNWDTPWFGGGQFCGSRGLALPLLGLRVRLTASAADRFELTCWASFVGAGLVGPIAAGALCAAGEAPLEAIRFRVVPRVTPPPGAPATKPRRR